MKNSFYYVSIARFDHNVYEFVGENAANNLELCETFRKFGRSGLPGEDQKEAPYEVLRFPSFQGKHINEWGDPWPGKHVPKQVIFTWRTPHGITHEVWCQKSTQDSKDTAYAVALEKNYLVHQFDVGTINAVGKALEAHLATEVSSQEAMKRLRTLGVL